MDVYLVGGAVRDRLLGLPVVERDYVVVGATPEAMLELGYRQVGRDFPVFLHPETGDEYALARTERKVGPGHTGFECHAGPDVTLTDDLKRRDLTVNAIAEAADGTLIDPWHGAADLASRRLRHISPAFAEDPLRVFRVARFAARFAGQGFEVVPETLELMGRMARAGVLGELAPERVFGELEKALASDAPGVFFEVLDRCGALAGWFEELTGGALHEWLALLARIASALPAPEDRYASIGWVLDDFGARLRAPNAYQRLLAAVVAPGRALPGWRDADPERVLGWIKRLDAFRQPARFARLVKIVACCADADLAELTRLVTSLRRIDVNPLRARGLAGAALGAALDAERVAIIRAAQSPARSRR